eukprot:15361979-Heterocapsa_arctica.AAC.1
MASTSQGPAAAAHSGAVGNAPAGAAQPGSDPYALNPWLEPLPLHRLALDYIAELDELSAQAELD